MPTVRVMGTCPVCHHVIVLDYRDKLHKVGHCTGCGLEYGNQPLSGIRFGAPRRVITDLEVQRMVNEAYGVLIVHNPRLKAATLLTCIDKVAVRMTGYGCPDVPIWKFNQWGYDIVAGYITRRERGEQ